MDAKETTTKIDNAKYQREKRRQEALSAILFLLPNFIGFLIITFLPIFATFILAFTEWDGVTSAKPASIEVSFMSQEELESDYTIPEGTVLVYTETEVTTREVGITVPFVINEDIVIPAGEVAEYGLVDIQALSQWKSYKGDSGTAIISPVSTEELPAIIEEYDLTLEEDEFPYIKEKELFFPKENITAVNPRFLYEVDGIAQNLSINMNNPGKEIMVTATDNEEESVTIPAGTIFVVDVFIKKTLDSESTEYRFDLSKELVKNELIDLRKPIVVDTDDLESGSVVLLSDQNGELDLLDSAVASLTTWRDKLSSAQEGTTAYTTAEKNVESYMSYIAKDFHFETGESGETEIDENIIPNIKFVKEKGANGLKFIGLKNFRDLFVTDPRFKDYLINTLVFLLEIPIGMAISLIMALAMNQPLKGIVVFRVLYFLPNISNLVAIALLWRWILNPDYGFLNSMLRAIGIMNPPKWFAHEGWAKVAIIIVDVWKAAGYNMMLYLAGLQGIPHFLYEAADIDGASGMQQFWKITWPLLGPTHFFILIMGVIGGFQAFGTQYVMTSGGPAGSTTTIVYYIYNHAYKWGHMGYATAIAVVLFVFVMIITIIQWNISEGNVEY